MYLSPVSIMEVVDARFRSLDVILRDYVSRNFTGYVAYINEPAGIHIYIAIINGEISACRSLNKNTVEEGLRCIDLVSSIIKSAEGVIEVYSSDALSITRDILLYPLSRIRETPEIRSKLQIEKASATITETHVLPGKEFNTMSLKDECIDPVTLYNVIKASKLLEVKQETLTIREIAQKIKQLRELERPKYIYISGDLNRDHIRIIYSFETNNLNIEVLGDEVFECGRKALDRLTKDTVLISNIKVWIVT